MRAQLSWEFIVLMIIILASFVVLVVWLWPVISEAIWGSAEVGECALSTLLSAGIAKGTLGVVDVPPQCKTKRVHVTDEYLKELVSRYDSSKKISKYLTFPDGSPQYRLGMIYLADRPERAARRWAFNKLIAEELNECRRKYLVDLRLGEKKWPWEAVSGIVSGVPSVCYPCARIVIDESVKNSLGYEYYGFQFGDWLKAEKPLRSEKSYYDLIYDSVAGFPEVGEPGEFENLTRRDCVDRLDAELSLSVHKSSAIAVTHKYTAWPTEFVPLIPGEWDVDWRYFMITPYGELADRCSVIVGV